MRGHCFVLHSRQVNDFTCLAPLIFDCFRPPWHASSQAGALVAKLSARDGLLTDYLTLLGSSGEEASPVLLNEHKKLILFRALFVFSCQGLSSLQKRQINDPDEDCIWLSKGNSQK